MLLALPGPGVGEAASVQLQAVGAMKTEYITLLSSVQDGISALGKAHVRSSQSLRSVPMLRPENQFCID